MADEDRVLARLDRWWQAAGWYVPIGVPLILGILSAALHSQALARATWALLIVGFLVNLAYVVAIVRLLRARRRRRRRV